jgi:hypothetical protein
MKYLLIVCILLIGAVANAQSPFSKEVLPTARPSNPYAHALVVQADSFVNAWRFTANVAAYCYTFGSGGTSGELTGAEFGYQHQQFNYATQTLSVVWSINAAWFPINTALPITLSNIQTFGLTFGFKNPVPVGNSIIQVGPDYNPNAPKTQHFGVLATVGILLN